jgi:hypothetical protein
MEERGLARTVRTDETDDSSFGNGQRAVRQCPATPIAHSESACFEDRTHVAGCSETMKRWMAARTGFSFAIGRPVLKVVVPRGWCQHGVGD